MKTVNLERLEASIRHRLEHMDWMFTFCANKGFRKWRFKTYRFRQKTMAWACQRLTQGSSRVCVGLGDWSQQDGMKGEPKAPVKAFKQELKRYAKRVVDIDEYLTSQTCSCCYCKVTKTVWAERKKKKNNKNKQARKEKDVEENEKKARFCPSNNCPLSVQCGGNGISMPLETS